LNKRDSDLFRDSMNMANFKCNMGHVIPYADAKNMNPDMKPFITREIPNPAVDVKVDLHLRKDIWMAFTSKYNGRVAATLNSVVATMLDDDFMLLTGDTARKLKKQNIKTQEDVIAMVADNVRLSAENEAIVKENIELKAGKGSGVDYTQIAKLVAKMQASGEIEV